MSRHVDLNVLRETILRNQQRRDDLPSNPKQKVFVDKQGQIVTGDAVQPGEERRLSEVHQGVFASTEGQLARDRRIVRDKFPENAREFYIDGVTGWV